MSAILTDAQIAAGAAVCDDHGQPIGRNTAIMVFDAMNAAGTTSHAAPAGWKLVPIEPTADMIAEIHMDVAFTSRALRSRYASMLAAAPAAPSATPGDAAASATGARDAARLEKFIDWYLRDGKRSEINPDGHMTATTREMILAWLDARGAADAGGQNG